MKWRSSFRPVVVITVVGATVLTDPMRTYSQPVPSKYREGLAFAMPQISVPVFPDRSVSIVDHGANGDGQTSNTKAFADAINSCSDGGGGRVIVPSGVWLTGPIRLKSNIELHLDPGALILFSKNRNEYVLVPTPTPTSKNYVCESPISGYGLDNIAITGEGIIDGSGEVWRPMKKEKYTANEWKRIVASGGVLTSDGKMWWPSQQAMDGERYLKSAKSRKKEVSAKDFAGAHDFLRPHMVQLYGCKNVLLDGPTFRNSPKFNIHPQQCQNVVIRNINVSNAWNAQNGDGIDIGSCHNVVVYNCTVDVGDDAICIKPGTIEKGAGREYACENIVIADCIVYRGHGGFVIGSESYGGARNIAVRNCTFIGTDIGLRFKSARDRGGVVEQIAVDGIRMKDIVNEAILFDLFYEDNGERGESTIRMPRLKDFDIKNIVCDGATDAVRIRGLHDSRIENISLRQLSIRSNRAITLENAESIVISGAKLGFVSGPVISVKDCKNIELSNTMLCRPAEVFVRVDGEKTEDIRLSSSDVSKATRDIDSSPEVKKNAIIIR